MSYVQLEKFKKSFSDFCRPNRFIFYIEDDEDWQEDFQYLCRACSIPTRTVGDVPVNWQGMVYHVPGDPSFDTFTVTFYNDIDYKIRDYFEAWMELIAEMDTNKRDIHSDIKATLVASQLNGEGEIVKKYKLQYAHPTAVSEIELDWETNDTIETFTVTFVYSYFEVSYGYDSSAGNDIKTTLEKKQSNDMKKDLQKPTNNSGSINYTGNAALSNLGLTSNNRLY